MREAPVGWQCPECIHRDARSAPVTRWRPRRQGPLGATRLTPVVTVLIALNVAVYLLETADPAVEARFALVPFLVPSQPYRLITAAFLHLDLVHIAMNMLVLLVVGPAVEVALGRVRTATLYLLAAFGGEVLSYLLGPVNEVSLGASGAIFGLMGGYFVLARHRGWDTSTVVPLLLVNLVFSFVDPAIDWRAHVGGLVVGAVTARIVVATEDLAPGRRRVVEPAALVGVLAVITGASLIGAGRF